jgi:hypothetical protein
MDPQCQEQQAAFYHGDPIFFETPVLPPRTPASLVLTS